MRKIILIIALAFMCAFVHAQADLAITGNVGVVAPNPVHVGITINITFNVQNVGKSSAAATHTGIYISPTTSISAGKLISRISLEPLAAGATSNGIQFNFPIPYNTVAGDGTYYVIVNLNDDGAISETTLSNNSASAPITANHSPWAAQNIPYPIIFVHGYMSDNTTWNTMIDSLEDFYGWSYGGNMNFCLNQDSNTATSLLDKDYKDYTVESHDLLKNVDFYTINFAVNPDGTTNYNNVWESNQAAIAKQGFAIQDAIKHVLNVTGKDKVILVCHSMGGLAAREYLQNTGLYQASDKKKHIARLVTIGTPHGGTNIPALDLGEAWKGLDVRSEAIRDLRTSYSISHNQGVYLFGGTENATYMDDGGNGFYNVDVNCNGTSEEHITGINNELIPIDLTYSCEIGLSDGGGGTTDGVVGPDQANINNYLTSLKADTFILRQSYLDPNPFWHLEETQQFAGIIRGMDEPANDFDSGHAYSIYSGQLYYGNLTAQSGSNGNSVRDYDGYTINVSANGNLNIQVYDIPTLSFSINVFNSSKTQVFNLDNHGKSYLNADVPVTKGSYYVVLSGVPNPDSYKYPYAFKCTFNTTTSYCSGTTNLTATSGTFNDGSGTNVNYSNNADCRWKIQPSGATSISLSFSAFKVSNPGDTVYVYDGSTTSSPLLGKWTGSTLPKKVTSKGGIMLVRFSTDAANTDAGWQASYTSVIVPVYCGTTTYTNASGVVYDGSGSNNYGNDSRCSWLITPEGAYSVTLNFTAFNTEPTNDVVKVYDGNNDGAPLLGSFSGNSIPASVTSSGGAMFIEFITNDTITAAGWSAYYTSYAPYSTTGIVNYESWFDNNYSNKTSVAVAQQDTFRLNSSITTTGLLQGLHSFHIRFKDAKNAWSSVVNQFFIKLPPTSSSNAISAYEYWFDSNYVSKISQQVTGTQNYQLLTGLSAASLSSGLHSFHIRFKDVGNVWSSVVNQFFIKIPQALGSAAITTYEYWYDNNYAGKISAGVTNAQTYQLITNLNTISLLQGLHSFHIRFKDAGNAWSEVINQYFVKTPQSKGSNTVTAYEYWLDNNYAGKISQPVTAKQNYQLLKSLHVSTLPMGLHSFHIRFKDSSGAWSSVLNQFIIYVPQGANTINRHEYWFNNDYAHKVYKVDTATSSIYILNISVPASALKNGAHVFHIRLRQTNNLWSSVLSQSFTKTSTLQFASIGISSNTLSFTDASALFVYPNPNKGKFTIGIDDDANIKSITIADGNGRIVYNKSSLIKTTILEIDLSKYASGIYYINATDGKKIYSKKVVIAK